MPGALLGLLLFTSTSAEPLRLESGPGRLEIIGDQIREDGTVEIALSGDLKVKVVLEGPSGFEVEITDLSELKGWLVQSEPMPRTLSLGNGKDRKEWLLILEPLQKPGKTHLQLAPVHYRGPDEQNWKKLQWPAIPIEVTSRIVEADPSQLQDDLPIERLPSEKKQPWLLYLLLGALVLGTVIAVATVVRRRQPPVPSVPPGEKALKAFARMEEQLSDLPASTICTDISTTLRDYLEGRYEFRALAETTPELLQQIRGSSILNEDQGSQLEGVLCNCDRMRFTGLEAQPEEVARLVAMAKAIVVEWESEVSKTG